MSDFVAHVLSTAAVGPVVVATASLIHQRLQQVSKGKLGKGKLGKGKLGKGGGGGKDLAAAVADQVAEASGSGAGKGGKVMSVDGESWLVNEEPRCKQQWQQQVSATSSLHAMCQCVRRLMTGLSNFVASCHVGVCSSLDVSVQRLRRFMSYFVCSSLDVMSQ
jgi:hypothetical protein